MRALGGRAWKGIHRRGPQDVRVGARVRWVLLESPRARIRYVLRGASIPFPTENLWVRFSLGYKSFIFKNSGGIEIDLEGNLKGPKNLISSPFLLGPSKPEAITMASSTRRST